jgi:hypothetical protein
MSSKDYLEFIFFIVCSFITIFLFDLLVGINTGLNSKPNCIVGLDFSNFINFISSYGLYFFFGIFMFGFSVWLYYLLKTHIPFFANFFNSKSNKEPSTIFNIILSAIFIPGPLILYDMLYCY